MSEKTWCIVAHLCGLAGYVVPVIGGVGGPLIIWLMKKDVWPVVGAHALEALNFNISVLIYGFVLIAFAMVTFGLGALIAVPAGFALWILHLVCTIMAAVKVNEGKPYRYPFTLRLIK